jgi:hypothetical protein
MTPHFKKVAPRSFNCQYCSNPITLMRAGVWRSLQRGTLCLKSPDKRHQPYDDDGLRKVSEKAEVTR